MASQALTTELRTIRENSSVDITEQIEKLCRISVERDEMQRKLNEAGNNSMALNEAHEQVRLRCLPLAFLSICRAARLGRVFARSFSAVIQ
jgi:hypothetical protein